jgi:hypothetical protein
MELQYNVQGISVADMLTEINALWDELLVSNSDLHRRATQLGIDIDAITMPGTEAIQVRRDGSGFDAATTAVIVSFSPVAAKVLSDLWSKLILPRLIRKNGDDSILPRK